MITLYDVPWPGTRRCRGAGGRERYRPFAPRPSSGIVPNQVGRDTVGIEVPNPTKEKVRLKELMGKTELFGKMKLPMFLSGKDATGQPLIADLTRMPHADRRYDRLGQSVCMNTIIMRAFFTKKPTS